MSEPYVQQSVSFRPTMLDNLRKEAERREMSLSGLIREYVRQVQGIQSEMVDLMREVGADDDKAAH